MKQSTLAPGSNIVRLDHSSITCAEPALAWNIFVDWRRWGILTEFRSKFCWTHGTPWTVGSRLRMEVAKPARFVVNRVITMSRPPEAIAWIDHSGTSTVEQWLTFEIDPDAMTCVHIISQVLGTMPEVAGKPFISFLDSSVRILLDRFCRECDRAKSRG